MCFIYFYSCITCCYGTVYAVVTEVVVAVVVVAAAAAAAAVAVDESIICCRHNIVDIDIGYQQTLICLEGNE